MNDGLLDAIIRFCRENSKGDEEWNNKYFPHVSGTSLRIETRSGCRWLARAPAAKEEEHAGE
jgi:superfamily I DNA and RNA helicase